MTQRHLSVHYTKQGYNKTIIDKIVDKGNFITMWQRMDIYILHGTLQFPDRVCIKTGKIYNKDDVDFCNKEKAQEFRIENVHRLDRMITDLIKAKIFLLKLKKKLNHKTLPYYLRKELEKVDDIYRNRI